MDHVLELALLALVVVVLVVAMRYWGKGGGGGGGPSASPTCRALPFSPSCCNNPVVDTLQQKIDATPPGGTVFVTEDHRLLRGLLITKPLRLVGKKANGEKAALILVSLLPTAVIRVGPSPESGFANICKVGCDVYQAAPSYPGRGYKFGHNLLDGVSLENLEIVGNYKPTVTQGIPSGALYDSGGEFQGAVGSVPGLSDRLCFFAASSSGAKVLSEYYFWHGSNEASPALMGALCEYDFSDDAFAVLVEPYSCAAPPTSCAPLRIQSGCEGYFWGCKNVKASALTVIQTQSTRVANCTIKNGLSASVSCFFGCVDFGMSQCVLGGARYDCFGPDSLESATLDNMVFEPTNNCAISVSGPASFSGKIEVSGQFSFSCSGYLGSGNSFEFSPTSTDPLIIEISESYTGQGASVKQTGTSTPPPQITIPSSLAKTYKKINPYQVVRQS